MNWEYWIGVAVACLSGGVVIAGMILHWLDDERIEQWNAEQGENDGTR